MMGTRPDGAALPATGACLKLKADFREALAWLLIGMLAPVAAMAQPASRPPVDPLTVTIETGDADRFAALLEKTGGKPTAAQIQREYLTPGSYGVRLFTPNRIISAARLAEAVAVDPELYARAVGRCLPLIKQTTAELRATYLAFRGLFPDKPLPRIYLVVGAGNSGGTAGPGAQVLGLEVLCRLARTPEALRDIMRGFYAHETVHALQGYDDPTSGNILLGSVLQEGSADFIASLVNGQQMNPGRAAWGMAREAELWGQFEADLQAVEGASRDDLQRGTPAGDAFYRWIANDGDAPEGWPGEAGYWIGQRIWQRWYDAQRDKRAALRDMLMQDDPEAILAAGRYQPAAQP